MRNRERIKSGDQQQSRPVTGRMIAVCSALVPLNQGKETFSLVRRTKGGLGWSEGRIVRSEGYLHPCLLGRCWFVSSKCLNISQTSTLGTAALLLGHCASLTPTREGLCHLDCPHHLLAAATMSAAVTRALLTLLYANLQQHITSLNEGE